MGKKEVILGKPGAPYGKGIKANGFLFVSGNVSIGKDGKPQTGDIKVQTRQVLQNLKEIVEGLDSSFDDVVKVNIYLTDIQDFSGMNEVYKEFFTTEPPTRTTVGVKELSRPEFIVEIDLMAVL